VRQDLTVTAVRMLQVPYDSGHRAARMGAGPPHLVAAGAADRLRATGATVGETVVEPEPGWRSEIATGFELMRRTAEHCRRAVDSGEIPVVLAGNCGITVGVVAGVAAASGRRVGVVWLDAHADFTTPETTSSGFLDGMGLAVLTGRCWTRLAGAVPGHRPVPEEAVVLVGARDFSAGEEAALDRSGVIRVRPAELADLDEAVDRLATRADTVHLHVDLDVHDPSIAPANGYAAPGGLTAEQVRGVARTVARRLPLCSATLAAYDPSYDQRDRMRDTALDLLGELGTILPAS
jgi:arginase